MGWWDITDAHRSQMRFTLGAIIDDIRPGYEKEFLENIQRNPILKKIIEDNKELKNDVESGKFDLKEFWKKQSDFFQNLMHNHDISSVIGERYNTLALYSASQSLQVFMDATPGVKKNAQYQVKHFHESLEKVWGNILNEKDLSKDELKKAVRTLVNNNITNEIALGGKLVSVGLLIVGAAVATTAVVAAVTLGAAPMAAAGVAVGAVVAGLASAAATMTAAAVAASAVKPLDIAKNSKSIQQMVDKTTNEIWDSMHSTGFAQKKDELQPKPKSSRIKEALLKGGSSKKFEEKAKEQGVHNKKKKLLR